MSELQLLRRTSLLSGLEETAVKFLADDARSVFVRRDDFFYREFDEGVGIFVLLEGRTAELRTLQHKRHLLRYIEPKDTFGEMAILERAPRTSTIAAVADSVALEIPAARFRKLNQNDLRQFTLVQANLCRELQKRLADTQQKMFADPEETVILKGEQVLRPPA